jgi:photosystem II stability/assembly factor-like uncharacterized protein
MKNHFFFIICSLYLLPLILTAQWEWQNPLPQGNTINSMCFVDENNGWAVGDKRTIIHTSDGGVTWDFQESGGYGQLYSMIEDVFFTDPYNGWAVGSLKNFIIHTNDGGLTWTVQMGEARAPIYMYSVWFTNDQTGWTLGYGAINGMMIYYTTDGGENWNSKDIDSLSYARDVCFVNDSVGWIVGNRIVYTTDGGATWEAQNSNTSSYLEEVFFLDADHGWAVGSGGTVLFTSNGGSIWESSQDTSLSGVILESVSFINTDTGWIGGYYFNNSLNGVILKTTDGGLTWEKQLSSAPLRSIYCLASKNGTEVFAAGLDGEMLKTTGGGNGWLEIYSSITSSNFWDVFFIDVDNGWASGQLDSGDITSPVIFHTSNGGSTWIEQYVPFTGEGYVSKLFFTDAENGWALGSGGLIQTTNGGEDWQIQSTEAISIDIYFISFSVGWLVGCKGAIKKTEDGGWNWTDQSSGTDRDLNSVVFLDDDRGWIAGDSIILRTENGGLIWEELAYNQSWDDIFFVDDMHGWVTDGRNCGGITMKTSDGGETWEEIFESVSYGFYEVFFIDTLNGWGKSGCCYEGSGSPLIFNVWHTSDGGLTWNLQNVLASGFSIVDACHGWAVGENGKIMHFDNGGLVGTNDLIIPESGFPIQIYPNPFSIATKIEFDVPYSARIEITIFSQSGHLIRSITAEPELMGKYQYTLDTSGLPSGVYYLRVRAGHEVAVKKIVKIR